MTDEEKVTQYAFECYKRVHSLLTILSGDMGKLLNIGLDAPYKNNATTNSVLNTIIEYRKSLFKNDARQYEYEKAEKLPEDDYICMAYCKVNEKWYGCVGYCHNGMWNLFNDTKERTYTRNIKYWSYIEPAFSEFAFEECGPTPMQEFKMILKEYEDEESCQKCNDNQLNEDAKKTRAEYLREWRKKNPEKTKEYNDRYWKKRVMNEQDNSLEDKI